MKSITVTERRRLIVLCAAWLFDSTSAVLRANPVITLDGSAIAAVGYGIAPPEKAGLVDLGGTMLLPGLIDTHVHLAFDASRDPVASLAARDDTEALAAMTAAARTAPRCAAESPPSATSATAVTCPCNCAVPRPCPLSLRPGRR